MMIAHYKPKTTINSFLFTRIPKGKKNESMVLYTQKAKIIGLQAQRSHQINTKTKNVVHDTQRIY